MCGGFLYRTNKHTTYGRHTRRTFRTSARVNIAAQAASNVPKSNATTPASPAAASAARSTDSMTRDNNRRRLRRRFVNPHPRVLLFDAREFWVPGSAPERDSIKQGCLWHNPSDMCTHRLLSTRRPRITFSNPTRSSRCRSVYVNSMPRAYRFPLH